MPTLVPAVSNLLGTGDGKHMVATVVVYFHPARNAGSMIEACLLALGAFLYAGVISFASMGVSVFFGKQGMIWLGHLVVLVIFCGGGLGFVGWFKQRLGNPLVNVACSLASLAIITVLTREDAIHLAKFSYRSVEQVLYMVLMGVFISSVVSFTIKPRSARKELKEDLVKITDHMEVFLTFITRGFLSGSNEDCNNEFMELTQKKYNFLFSSLVRNLREAKFEHYALGTEKIHELEVKLVKCIEHLAQDLDGLRSAASTQFDLIKGLDDESDLESPIINTSQNRRLTVQFTNMLEPIEEVSERGTPNSEIVIMSPPPLEMSAADIFSLFISRLGPPMKSLAFTIKGVLNDLPFGPAPKYDIVFNENFIRNLTDAKDLFIAARKEALDSLYSQRHTITNESTDAVAEYEEVAASCGYFSSSLEDFAEDTIMYLEVLSELKAAYDIAPRSWQWLLFWRYRSADIREPDVEAISRASTLPNTQASPTPDLRPSRHSIPNPAEFSRHALSKVIKYRHNFSLTYRFYRATAILRREDVKFAIKVGIGAMLYAFWSFLPSTRPIYARWRGEWGLLSYMLVCSMTIGASNTTGLQRFGGTCVGAILAIVVWLVSAGNAIALGVLGWVVSLFCFSLIVIQGKGPMGRFIFLTYNLSALYAYSLSVKDMEDDDDEGGAAPEIYGIALHRVVAVFAGCLWGIIVTRLVFPISARKKIKNGIALLWLRMSLIWKRDPLQMLLEGGARVAYVDIREEIELRRFLRELEALRAMASHEFDLRGPFEDTVYRKLLECTGRVLGAFHAMQVVIVKDLKASEGEVELLKYTRDERGNLSTRICHLFGGKFSREQLFGSGLTWIVLASSMKLEYPINDSLPIVDDARDKFLGRLYEYRSLEAQITRDEDFELLYAYGKFLTAVLRTRREQEANNIRIGDRTNRKGD
jgi:hypothetical protein